MLLDQVVLNIYGLCMSKNYANESGGGLYSFGSFMSLWHTETTRLNCSGGNGYSAVFADNEALIGGTLFASKTFLNSKTDVLDQRNQGAQLLFCCPIQ